MPQLKMIVHEVIEALSENVSSIDWKKKLAAWKEGNYRLHLAVFVEPFLGWVLDGTKIVESRFSVNRCAPFGQVKAGDVLAIKKSGGPIVALAKVGNVWSYILDPDSLQEIRENFAKAICAHDSTFWENRKSACYATLIKLEDVIQINPTPFQKRDRRGWVVLKDTAQLQLENLV